MNQQIVIIQVHCLGKRKLRFVKVVCGSTIVSVFGSSIVFDQSWGKTLRTVHDGTDALKKSLKRE